MTYQIKNPPFLRQILWLDTALGSTTAIVGITFSSALAKLFGLPTTFLWNISVITGLYAIGAFYLAKQRETPVALLRILVFANWLWAIVSVGFLSIHAQGATSLGQIFLALQIIVVGGLAYVEGQQIIRQ